MEIRKEPDATVVVLRGRFDADAVAAEGQGWDQLVDQSEDDLCLDLSQVTFLDSAGIGTIAFLVKRLAERGRELRLEGVNGQPQSLLRLLRVDRAILVTPARPAQPAARLEEDVMARELA